MHPQPRPHQHPDPASRARRFGVALATVLTLFLVAACGLRTETPPPVEPSPDATEQVRGRTVAQAQELAEDARTLSTTATEPLASVLADVASFSDQHAEQAGGTYVSGLPSATATSSPAVRPVPDLPTFLAKLAEGSNTALTDADTVEDGDLARLVASIATSRAELATRLATAAALPVPTLGPTPDDAVAPPATEPAPTSPSSPSTTDASDLDALALAHDQAGFGFEVIAAKLSGDQRAAARAAASAHRAESERWAQAAGSDGTARDPRRASYALPAGLDDPTVSVALARTLQTAVADAYANAVAGAPPGDRLPLITGLGTATTAAGAWGAAPIPFPGLPEQVQQPTP